jgi:adenosylcobinamide-GDP ribazoletransferase
MKNSWLGFKFALSYFTIIPIKFGDDINLNRREIFSKFLLSLPLVGITLALIVISLYIGLEENSFLALLVASFSYPMLYGFLHTEAIIDVVDAIYAKHSNKSAYEVIKEPTIGALGALWGVSLLLIKVALLAYLLYLNLYMAIISILISSRLTLLLLFITKEFKSSFLMTLKSSFLFRDFLLALAIFGTFGVFIYGYYFIILLIFSLLIGYFISSYFEKRLGFCNGDLVGFTLEIVEILSMILVIRFLHH